MNLREEIAGIIKGEALDDVAERKKYSRDTSIFERMPSLIVYPKNADDVEKLVRFVNEKNSKGVRLTLTARAGGSDMSGGPLTDSILVVFTKYINKIGPIVEDSATVEPGAFYRDFEKETLARGEILPSYPASRGMCTIGGMIANNAGGELNLHYGKTDEYVESLDVVLSDGTQAQIKPLTLAELAQKESGNSCEASIYRQVHALIEEHQDDIQSARPNVTKNSAGFALWDVLDKEQGIFDLTKLIVGSQGTLGLITKAQMRLVRTKAERAMLVIFISDLGALPEIVHRVLKFEPESFESYDNHTFSLAVHLLPQIIAQFGILKMIILAFAFLPEMWAVFRGGVPKLVLMAEFAEDTDQEALDKAEDARVALDDLPVRTKIAKNEVHAEKYWAVRRGSFALLRKNLHGLYAAPFIDDIVVHPDD
ncbi:MAG TPA: FAD-binding oxidoreductase, partial [Candidatus Paceibacterota bacterium]